MAKRSSNEFLAAWMILFAVILVGGLIWVIARESTLAWLVFIGAGRRTPRDWLREVVERTEVGECPGPGGADRGRRLPDAVLVDDGPRPRPSAKVS